MLGVLVFTWFALAVIFTAGFYLVRQHYIRIGETQRRHPMYGNGQPNVYQRTAADQERAANVPPYNRESE